MCLFSQWGGLPLILVRKAPLFILFHYICAHVTSHTCPSYKLMREVIKCNFKMKHDLKTNKQKQLKKICLIFCHFLLVATDYFWSLSYFAQEIFTWHHCHTLHNNLFSTNTKCLGFSKLYSHETFLFPYMLWKVLYFFWNHNGKNRFTALEFILSCTETAWISWHSDT